MQFVAHRLDGQRHGPHAVVGVAMEAGVLVPTQPVVGRLVLRDILEEKGFDERWKGEHSGETFLKTRVGAKWRWWLKEDIDG